MYQIINGRLCCDGTPIGVRLGVVKAVLEESEQPEGTSTIPTTVAVDQMLRMERELLLAEVQISVRRAMRSVA